MEVGELWPSPPIRQPGGYWWGQNGDGGIFLWRTIPEEISLPPHLIQVFQGKNKTQGLMGKQKVIIF